MLITEDTSVNFQPRIVQDFRQDSYWVTGNPGYHSATQKCCLTYTGKLVITVLGLVPDSYVITRFSYLCVSLDIYWYSDIDE